MREADCLAACYAHGHEWEQDGVRLYDILDRVSCWCCKNKNQKELRAIKENLPDCWRRLVAMEEVLGNMKRRTCHLIHEVEEEDDEFFDTVELHYYVCSECGRNNRPDAYYCDSCGAKVVER